MIAQRGRAALMTSAALLAALAVAGADGASAAPKRHRAATAPDADLFDPGDDARAALSRLVAEPGSVLDAYAPARGGLLPDAGDVPDAGGVAGAVDAGAVGGAPAPAPVPGGPTAGVATSPSDPMAFAPVADDGPVLDAATLRRAIESWVDEAPAASDPRRRALRAAIAAVYAERGYAPLWAEGGRLDARGRAVSARIDRAAEDGLDLRAFAVPVPAGASLPAVAAAELSLSEAAAEYARQATGGRVDPARIGALVAARPDVASPARALAALRDSLDPAETLRAFNPSHAGYAALRAKLAEIRRSSEMTARASPIPFGPVLKEGMRDARVPLIRARFGLDIAAADPGADGLVYDTKVAGAVADYQRSHHMPASGALTARTIASLSGGQPLRLEGEILANMERWRWLPRDLGARYVAVNIPDFSLDVMDHGRSVHHARVVVGKPDHETPVFSETMRFVIVNPYWNVPLSIVKKEMMPKLAADPNYFENHGYETVERDGETYVRQPPGDGNALGRIKFMFPNRFSVYLHDTNARSLFGRDARALSHGCVRVDQPFRLAEAVLGRGWSEARVKALVGSGERTINLREPLPIHINYFTAFVDEQGVLRLRDDVYGYSARVRAALGPAG